MDLPSSVGSVFRFSLVFPQPGSHWVHEQWCWCEFLLWAGGTCAQAGAAHKGFYTRRSHELFDYLLGAMRYGPRKVTDNVSFSMAVPR